MESQIQANSFEFSDIRVNGVNVLFLLDKNGVKRSANIIEHVLLNYSYTTQPSNLAIPRRCVKRTCHLVVNE